jgi:hypothetical protein
MPFRAPGDPLLGETRRFLRPLVGVDPASVTVYRSTEAAQAASAAHADALAVDDVAIVLPSTMDEREPKTLGLLAHELTHVAHSRERAARTDPDIHGATASDTAAEREEEESRARVVEARVHSVAAHAQDSTGARNEDGADFAADRGPAPASLPAHPADVASHLPAQGPRREDRRPWGTLPAPWEPIPELDALAPLAPDRPARAPFDGTTGSRVQRADAAIDGHAANGDGTPGVDVRLAESARSVAVEPEVVPQPTPPASGPDVDIDRLARSVYDILKRRLAAERRRTG